MAVRWNTTSRLATFATSGTSCTELAALPITATRCPVRSTPSGQRAEWNSGPANESRPGMSGSTGSLNIPSALDEDVDDDLAARVGASRHTAPSSSHDASVTLVPSDTWGMTPYFSAQCSR